MDGHHPDGVDIGLRQNRLGDPGAFLALPSDPGEVGPEAAVLSLRPRPGLVDDEPEPAPLVAGPRLRGGHLEHPAVVDQQRQHRVRGQPADPVVQAVQVVQRGGDRVPGQSVGDRCEEVERAAVVLPGPQVVVAQPEQRRAQSSDQGQGVAGVRDARGRPRADRVPPTPGRPASSTRPDSGSRLRRTPPRARAARSEPATARRCPEVRSDVAARPEPSRSERSSLLTVP